MGCPTVFVRLTGCPLRCQYCDSAYALAVERYKPCRRFRNGKQHGVNRVTVTGGEPLAQPGVHPLMTALVDEGFSVSLETSGALSVEQVDPEW